MTDTQWPRYMVFEKTKNGKPHQQAGTVHAPDIEMALLNARDVFVRRPETISQWIVRADTIFSKTIQELANSAWAGEYESGEIEPYYVFYKLAHNRSCVYTGKVEAGSPQEAIKQSLETYINPKALMWWVFPVSAVLHSEDDDLDPLYAPARQKYYRHQTQFTNAMLLKKMKSDWREQQEEAD